MTTVAVNRQAMACDLQMTHGLHTKFKCATKIVTLKPTVAKHLFDTDKAFIGFAGNADIWSEFVTWITQPEGHPPKMKNIEFLMLTKEGDFYHGSNMHNWMRIHEPHYAIGTGSHLAIAAMDAGKSPKEAVLIAAKHDPSTGMGVKEYKL